MAYWKKNEYKNYASLDNYVPSGGGSSNVGEYYEFEPALVLDIVLDETHEIFKGDNEEKSKIDVEHWPADLSGKKPNKNDVDLTWIGRALVRPLISQKNIEKEKLIWALPFEVGISEYPLINEIVICAKYGDQFFYTRKLNSKNYINTNADFNTENLCGGFSSQGITEGNRELNDEDTTFKGPLSQTKYSGGYGYQGVLGRYFYTNKNIRNVKRFEGDTVLESRFGSSIRFSVYDNDRNNDKGYGPLFGGYKEYKGTGVINSYTNLETGGGNPMIIIRNRQKPLVECGKTIKLHDLLPPINGTPEQKNVGGYVEEDINNDGTSIYITSGVTINPWKTTCYKAMFQDGMEEQKAFSPNSSTPFKFPVLNKDQLIVNTDRLVFSSRFGETLHFSKKRYGIVTDSEYSLDAHDQIILTTNNKVVVNSPAIYLGEYNQTNEPVLLGQTAVNWMYELCNWIIDHTHWHHHAHPNAGHEDPHQTQAPVEIQQLIMLRDKLHTLMSRRVFVTGGGFAPGQNGGNIKDGIPPTNINVNTGNGVPGGFNGENFRTL